MSVLLELTRTLPIGTNLALLHFLWMLVSGALLPARGALFPALLSVGLSAAATRRAWAAFRGGVWQSRGLVQHWRTYITGLPDWQATRYEGYRAVVADTVAFWRPTLQNCPSQHYHPLAQRALPAVLFGIVGEVGRVGGQRLACPRAFMRVDSQDPREARLWELVLGQLGRQLAADEAVVVDAGVKIRMLQTAQVERYVLRLATNFTARRNVVAPYKGTGRRPTYGEWVRPLARTRKGNVIPATAADREVQWEVAGVPLRAEIWEGLILPGVVPDPANPTFTVYAIYDPRYTDPWLLASPLAVTPATIQALYQDRWPVEQIPLSAKQMVGAHRQFVHAPASVQRLPELALLAGSVLSFLAATTPVQPTGFWDRQPKRTPGRFRRQLQGQPFPQSYPLPPQLRKKAAVTAHLPKGVRAHRRKKRPQPVQNAV